MRLTTITALASVVAAIAIGPEAIAQPYSQNPTPRRETRDFGENNSFAARLSEKQDLREFMIPSTEAGSSQKSDSLFSEPFYPSAAQRRYEDKSFSVGDRGSHIWILQRRLHARGFDPGPVDSVFGSQTRAAVKAFQKSRGLKATGAVDKTAWKALNQTEERIFPRERQEQPLAKKQLASQQTVLDKGNKGSKVKTLQLRLEIQGYAPGPIDGVFGSKTAAAVKQFQKAQGLATTGTVDEATWEALGRN